MTANCLFLRSVTSISPGECVIANGTFAFAMTACGVTPQAQNTGISSGAIGIADINKPDYGDPVPVEADEIAVFWACGVTPQAVIAAARLPFAITHAPGLMLVTDLKNKQLAVL